MDTPLADYLTTRQAADLLGVTKPYVDRLVWDGRLAATDTPLGRLLRRAEVEQFAQNRKPRGRPKRTENKGAENNS